MSKVGATLVGPETPFPRSHISKPVVSEMAQNIKVFVRARPLTEKEKRNGIELVQASKEIRVKDRIQKKSYYYDDVFSEDSTQIEVYREVVAPLIDQVLKGYNCTVFAYGQTGTGKTYTMEGEQSDKETDWENDPLSGIIPRSFQQLFETLEEQKEDYTVRVSFFELYNEDLYDLLSGEEDTQKLKIYEDVNRKGSVIIGNSEELTVTNKNEIYQILRKGSTKRQKASTLLNACSSRSHTIFTITVHIKDSSIDGEELVKVGKLNLVDLAGSENIGRSGATDKRAREASNINQSLLTLGRVITCLGEKASHVPYRESKLTRLLKDSLGGRTKTSIIATISPNLEDYEDTLSTLDYAQRAKKITNKPEVNQKVTKKGLIAELSSEIQRLQRDLQACRDKTGVYVNEANYSSMVETIESQNKLIKEKEDKVLALITEMAKIDSLFQGTVKQLEETQNDLKKHKEILSAQEQRQREMSEQANLLLDSFKQSTYANYRLHEKIERVSDIEKSNLKALKSFKQKFKEDIDNVDWSVSYGIEKYTKLLDEFKLVNLGKNESAINLLYRLGDDVMQVKQDNDDCFKKSAEVVEEEQSLNTKVGMITKTIEKTEKDVTDSIRLFNNFFNQDEKLFNEKMSDFESQYIDHENKIAHLEAQLHEARAKQREFVYSQLFKLKEMSQARQKTLSNLAKNNLKNLETIVSDAKKESLLIQEKSFSIGEQMCNLVELSARLAQKINQMISLKDEPVNLIRENSQHIANFSKESKEEMINLKSSVGRELQSKYNNLKQLIKSELKKDNPTGMTPKKTDYHCPEKLIQPLTLPGIIESQAINGNDQNIPPS